MEALMNGRLVGMDRELHGGGYVIDPLDVYKYEK